MPTERPYPKYSTYDEGEAGRHPSLLSQEYPRPTFGPDENYYPVDPLLEPYFSSRDESRKFSAASFCGFLEDTVEVEHCLVIPAIASIRRLPYNIPPTAEQDLYKLATDEGFHAEQSQQFLTDLRSHFGLARAEEYRTPLFLRRLEHQRSVEASAFYRDLITVLNGVVTETRISIELSKFAADKSLGEPVRTVCRTHAEDESIHASQFKALGEWLWEQFDEPTKTAAAGFYGASTIARSLPDVERISYFFQQATDRPYVECGELVYSVYTADVLIERLLIETRPTVSFLNHLGVDQYMPFSLALDNERKRLQTELAARLDVLRSQQAS
jgi:hypothetical protein